MSEARVKATILLVDDRPDNLDLLEAMLQGVDVETIRCENGERAVECLEEVEPALVLLDVEMPGMNGFETARVIRSLPDREHVPIIFVTAHGRGTDGLFTGYETGAVDYLFKPIDPRLVRAKCLVFLSLFQQRQLLAEQAAEIRRSNQELERFACVAAHDLKEPLRAVNGHLWLIEKQLSQFMDEDTQRRFGFAKNGAARMATLIDDLLVYARVNGEHQDFETVDLQVALEDAVAGLEAAIADSNAQIDAEQLPVVQGNRSMLTRVLQNLVANAVKFRSPGVVPRISIRSEQRVDAWIVTCSDNGIGIQKADLTSVFERFRRLHSREEYEGTGLGLAIASRIVTHHGGRIWAESAPGGGTAVRMLLPLTPSTEEPVRNAG